MAFTLSAGIGMLGACSRQMLATFFDLPQPTPRAAPEQARPGTAAEAAVTVRPPLFEGTLDPDSAVKLLPRDRAGNVDWVEALRREIIRPRPTLPGRPLPNSPDLQFNYDFYLRNADKDFDVSFAHSTHTQWLTCNSCHPRIFQYRGAAITMDDLGKGAFCAECHDKVAFPVETGCERCHIRLPAADSSALPELLGTTTLRRVRPDSATEGAGRNNAAGVRTDDLPQARFPHWVHRSRYLCKACHMELFVPKAGANVVTMKMIAEGKSCGACHDGKTAFDAGFGGCERCHTPPAKTATRP